MFAIAGDVGALNVVLEPVLEECHKAIIHFALARLEIVELSYSGGLQLLVLLLVGVGQAQLLLISEMGYHQATQGLKSSGGALFINTVDTSKETCSLSGSCKIPTNWRERITRGRRDFCKGIQSFA